MYCSLTGSSTVPIGLSSEVRASCVLRQHHTYLRSRFNI